MAGARRRRCTASSATDNSTVAFSASSSAAMSAPLLRCLVDQLFQASARLAVHITGADVEQRRQRAVGVAAEHRAQHVLERRAARGFARDRGPVVVARAVLFD